MRDALSNLDVADLSGPTGWLARTRRPRSRFYVQEMTVRLGAITKRGHADAIFDGFGPIWGWFSLCDLLVADGLTIVTS